MSSATPVEDIVTFLDGQFSLESGVNLFAAMTPQDPDDVTAILEYPGTAPDQMMHTALPATDNARIQVLCRSLTYITARDLAQQIWQALVSVFGQTINGTFYHNVAPLSQPALMNRDDQSRFQVIANYEIMRRLVP